MRALYSDPGDEEMFALVRLCESLTGILESLYKSLTEIPESLGNDHFRLHLDVRRYFLRCIDQMYEIVFNKDNDNVQEQGSKVLDELSNLLTEQV
ncbi:hypothetical protein AVEN_168201-1 [Araneus ventricosus]|uniref:Uncharacterized protein n=1 Tax=Araneus ventricosus TaxID=182803 RepID=A0A4Y2KKH3_ARAVE|nr:hypothetical protein AVEN_168201-1 [Araneus ventricosus]